MDKYSLSRNMGFITGPLMILLGAMSYNKPSFRWLAVTMIVLGTIRIGLTIYTYMMNKRNNQE